MEFRVFEDGDERSSSGTPKVDERTSQHCLFVLGWGNRCHHENVRWLVDQVSQRYRVHVAELPTHITDFQREWLTPVREYATTLDEFAILAHSAGGLTTAHLDADGITNRVYLSPWWDSDLDVPRPIMKAIGKLPISRPIIPAGIASTDMIGDLATEAQLQDGPSGYSPAFVRTIATAHETVPEARENAVSFCTLTDKIVDPRAVGERLPADRIQLYDGGHELFSSSAREVYIDDVLAALDAGPAAL